MDERTHPASLCGQKGESGGFLEQTKHYTGRGVHGSTHYAILWRKFSWISSAIDWMANTGNAQCSMYISHCSKPGAWGVDLFTHRPHKVSPRYCKPPWRPIPGVLKYLEQAEGYEVMLVVPIHPYRPCWHQFEAMPNMQFQ